MLISFHKNMLNDGTSRLLASTIESNFYRTELEITSIDYVKRNSFSTMKRERAVSNNVADFYEISTLCFYKWEPWQITLK